MHARLLLGRFPRVLGFCPRVICAILTSYLCSLLSLNIRKSSPAAATPAQTTAKPRASASHSWCSTHLLSCRVSSRCSTHSWI